VATVFDTLTPAWLRSTHIFGIDQTEDDGAPFPDAMYETAIRSSLRMLERDIGVRIENPRRYRERIDSLDWDGSTWHLKQTMKRPLRRVHKLSVRLGHFEPVELPISWVHIASQEAGQIQLLPSSESFSQAIGGYTLAYWLNQGGYVPGWFQIDFDAGFYWGETLAEQPTAVLSRTDTTGMMGRISVTLNQASGDADTKATVRGYSRFGETEEVIDIGATAVSGDAILEWAHVTSITIASPGTATSWTASAAADEIEDIKVAVALQAAMLPLDTAGDLIAGAGVAQKSTSMDGLSMSVSTTASATNHGLGAKMKNYKDRYKEIVTAIKRQYRTVEVCIL
jgi:hypothetical protein